jgi:REP element-mobilizing transposase RayT
MAIAYFSTWTTYGTWLPGDDRGWYQNGRLHLPDFLAQFAASLRMTDDVVTLTPDQRSLVESTIKNHCIQRGWTLHAVNGRTNHVHVAVTAPGRDLDIPRKQFKAWCTRDLKEQTGLIHRKHWWTHRGWDLYIDNAHSLETVISYINDCQDDPTRFSG